MRIAIVISLLMLSCCTAYNNESYPALLRKSEDPDCHKARVREGAEYWDRDDMQRDIHKLNLLLLELCDQDGV
jgi:hypothetical protein